MQKIDALQMGRALAALAVVAYHTGSSGAAFTSALPPALEVVLGLGAYGVDFFFVLSGFIIYHTTVDRTQGFPELDRYARKRAVRIFLPYWPICVGLACLYTLFPMFGASDRPWSWAETLTLLPLGQGSSLNVAWTLEHEVMFYIIFGMGLMLGRPLAVVGGWMVLVAGAACLGYWPERPTHGLHQVLLSPINLEFGFGVAAALWHRSGRVLPAGVAAAGIIGPLVLRELLGSPHEASVLVGLALAFLIAWAVGRESAGAFPSSRLLVFLGSASYAIYLIHTPLISLTSRLANTWPQALIGGVVVSVAAGVVYHLTIERPLLAVVSRKHHRPFLAGLGPAQRRKA